jgi:uncharacterized surface protein with fasciclin (FAS1) repeats
MQTERPENRQHPNVTCKLINTDMKLMKNTKSRWMGSLAAVALAMMMATPNAQAWSWWSWWNDSTPNIVERLEDDGRFTTLLTALEVAGLTETVATGGTFTLFAPTDDAFAALPEGTVEALVNDVPTLTQILLYHVVDGRKSAYRLVKNTTTATLQGNPVLVLRERRSVSVNQQRVSDANVRAENGVIHVVEGVLLPPDPAVEITSMVDVLKFDGRFNTLLAAVDAAGLSETLATGGPFTLFAPTDDAFAALPEGTVEALLADIPALTDILLYHVLGEPKSFWQLLRDRTPATLQGSEVEIGYQNYYFTVNDSSIINADVNTPNGVVHTLDKVLLPPAPPENLYDTLANDGRFNTLIAALGAAGLADAVRDGELTILAPTDDAFAALPEGTVEALLADIPALQNILLYHVVEGDRSIRSLLYEGHVPTLQGSSVAVRWTWRGIRINDSRVLEANINAANGQIHGINAVLLPPQNSEK